MILFAFIIGICLVGVLSSDGADAADGDEFTIEGIEYQIVSETDKTVKITDYTGSATVLTIPSNVTNGSVEYSVTSIGDNAFRECSSLISVTISDGVTSIEEVAFYGCSSLTSITIPNSVTSIGNGAFRECSALTSIIIPNSVTSIELYVFSGCSSLTSITIPNGVTSIGNYAFDGCRSLTSITIPNSVTSIGDYAFSGCRSLTSITIPNSVTSIESHAFDECSSLISITISNSVTSIEFYVFSGCRSLTSITIPNSVISLGSFAFNGCSSLTSITIPNSVTSIEKGAFSGCSSLTSITIPNSVTSIGDSAFEGCSSLTSITISDNVTSIGNRVFYGCKSLTSITIPNSVTSIGEETFYGCRFLTSVTIPNRVTSIGDRAFHGCSSLTSITIPDSVTSIGDSAFEGCSSLTSMIIPDNVTSIGDRAFHGCSSLTSVTIPNRVTSIGDRAFHGCSSLTSITIPDRVTSIGEETFNGCGSLTSITIPDSVTSIGDYAFHGCSSLTSVTIPNRVTSIGDRAFHGCSSLTSITIPDSVTSIGNGAFDGCIALTGIYVSDDNPNYMSDAEGVLFTEDGKELLQCPGGKSGSYEIPSGVESIEDYAFEGCSALTSITIPKSVTSIGVYAFDGCIALVEFDVNDENPNYKSDDEGILFDKSGTSLIKYPGGKSGTYTIPSGVTIKDHAFYGCVKLTAIHVEDNDLYSSNSGVLFNKDGTELICYPGGKEGPYTIPADVIKIKDGALRYCYGLTSLTVNWSNEYGIYDIMCLECPNVTEIIVLGNDILQSIDGSIYYVHENGLSLIRCPEGKTSLVLPESVVSISSEAVSFCHGLKEIVIKEGDSLDIEQYAFMQSNSDIIFKSGKDGFDLKAYIDEAKTNEITGAMLSSGWSGTLYFEWIIRQYNIVFDSAGGTSVESIIQDYGTVIVPPADPTRAGYRFDGWVPTIPDTMPAENVTCVAQWTELYTVSFDANGGTGSMEVEKTIGDYTLPVNGFTAPVEMEFKCWSVGGAEKNVGDVIEVTAPVTVVAVWKVIVHDEPPYVPSTEGEVTINTVEMTEGQTTTVTEVFEDTRVSEGKVEVEIGDIEILFDTAAVSAIGGNAVTLCAAIETEGHGIDGALEVIRVTLVGAVFPDGKATVSIPFTDTVPEGKVVKVYHIDGGDRRDMNAVLSGGMLTYESNFFSDFAVFIEDVPAPNDDDDGGFPVWAIVLIVVAVIAVAGGVGGYILLQKKKV